MQEEDIIARVRQDLSSLSKANQKIAGFLDQTPGDFIHRPIRELADLIGVSEPTLIRFSRHYGFSGVPDLRLAVAMSLASRSHTDSAEFEPKIDDKEVVNRSAKAAIAELASGLLQPNESILLDSGSTVQHLARYLPDADPLTIMTTSLNLAYKLIGCAQHTLILTGGIARQNARALSGRLVETSLEGMTFDKIFLGADRIDPDFGLSTFSEDEAHLNRAMLRASRKAIVLADSTKFGPMQLHRICDLPQIDMIISDDALKPEIRQAIEDQGIDLRIAQITKDSGNTK